MLLIKSVTRRASSLRSPTLEGRWIPCCQSVSAESIVVFSQRGRILKIDQDGVSIQYFYLEEFKSGAPDVIALAKQLSGRAHSLGFA